jgi:hypothetical protein
VRTVARLHQPVLAAPRDDFDLMRDVHLERLAQVEQARHAVDERNHVRGEVRLHGRVLVELVEHHLRVRVALQVDHQADRVAGREVGDVADALDPPLGDQLVDLRRDRLDRRLERQLGNEDSLRTVAILVDLGVRTHADRPPAGAVALGDAGPPENHRARGEVGPGHEPHEVFDGRVGIVDQVERGVDDLAQVVRRDVGGHADRNAPTPVHQEVREPRRDDERLAVTAVIGLAEIDGVLVDLTEQVHREW